jgi:hypothetical protein
MIARMILQISLRNVSFCRERSNGFWLQSMTPCMRSSTNGLEDIDIHVPGGERHFERLVCRKVSGIVVLFEK